MFPIISPFTSDWISFTILFFGIFGLIGSSELVRIKLGWKPEVSITDGLKSTIEWVKNNGISFNAPFKGWTSSYRSKTNNR